MGGRVREEREFTCNREEFPFEGSESVTHLGCMMVAQLCEYTKHC